jgi:hypothetical protein
MQFTRGTMTQVEVALGYVSIELTTQTLSGGGL